MPLTAFGRYALVLPLTGLLLAGPAAAVDGLDDLGREIARTERELEFVRQGMIQLAQSNFTPAEAGALERRFAAIEDEMRRLTGQVERLSYVQRQLADRMDRLQSDVEYRLTALEGGNPAGSAAPATTQSGDAGSPEVIGTVSAEELAQIQGGTQNQTASTDLGSGFSTDGSGGAITGQGGLPAYDNQQAGLSGVTLPAGTPREQYNYAFGLLRQADYAGAEQALLAFIQQNPGDPLVANAKYWLGETYYVRGDYQAASQAFAQSYQEHSTGSKAPDSLLKLGLSLSLMGQTGQACQVLQELDARLGDSAKANIVERARRERANLGC